MFRRRLCHFLTTDTCQTKSVKMAVCSGKRQRGQLAQRETRNTFRHDTHLPQGNSRRQIRQIQAGLCILRFFQFLCRTFKALAQCTVPQGFRPIEQCADFCTVFIKALSHAGFLRALSGKNKCYFTHFAAPFRSASASSATSFTISAAGCSFFTMPEI